MFEDSLLESGHRMERAKAGAMSFVAQSLFVCVLVILPLIYTEALPGWKLFDREIITPTPVVAEAPARPAERAVQVVTTESEIFDGRIREPQAIPDRITRIRESSAPPPNVSWVAKDGLAGNCDNCVLPFSSQSWTPLLPQGPPQAKRPVVSSEFIEGLLIRRVTPTYPPLAIATRIQGAVVLQAVISKGGTIEHLHVLSGPPLLIPPSLEAVKQWRYRPYVLNGEPVEVETTVTVNYVLGVR